jgi:cytochrome P450
VPFGWAPKSCIGANLGMAQLILLAHLVCTRYRLEVTQPERARMAVASLVRPIDFRGALPARDAAGAA